MRVVLVALVVAGFAFPFAIMVTTSFKTTGDIFHAPPRFWPTSWTLASFRAAFLQMPFWRYLGNTLLLCGMESHICVTQTALGALREGYLVHIASDAVSSRTEWNSKIGLDRMRAAGAIISSTEMMIYELMRSSSSAAFKELLPHLKG